MDIDLYFFQTIRLIILFLRIQTTFGKIQYTNLYAELQDINYFLNNNIDNVDQMGFQKNIFHHII